MIEKQTKYMHYRNNILVGCSVGNQLRCIRNVKNVVSKGIIMKYLTAAETTTTRDNTQNNHVI